MEDIIEKYKVKKRNKNLVIVLWSMALAFVAHFSLTSTDIWQNIRSSVIDSTTNKEVKADLYLKNINVWWNHIIEIKSWQNIAKIKSISFTIVYNSENIDIKDIFWEDENIEILEIWNENWLNSIIVNYTQETNIKTNQNIAKIAINKKSAEMSQLNIISANFIDINNNKYSLSTSWVEF